jgi:TRAP transporter TAXI family solute receptor
MRIKEIIKNIGVTSLLVFFTFTFTITIGLVTTLEAQEAPKHKLVIVSMLHSPIGAGGFEGYTVFGSFMAREHPWLMVQVQETPGYLYNLREVAMNKNRWKNTMFATEDTIIQCFFHGGRPEIKEFYPEPIKIKWKLLHGTTWATHGGWFVTLNPKLKTMADFKGKRIGLGLRTQSDWGADARIFLEEGYGITTKNSDLRHMSPNAAMEAMIDGKLDAAAAGMVRDATGKIIVPAGAMLLLEASGRKVYYVPIDKEAVDKVNKKYNTTYMTGIIPKGTFKGQENDILTAVDRVYTAVHPEFPDELAYEIVKMVIKLRKRMGEVHAFWKTTTNDETLVHGLSEENIHPGALRAIKEAGLWELAKKFPPMTYPEK